jgi:hypothetical protein
MKQARSHHSPIIQNLIDMGDPSEEWRVAKGMMREAGIRFIRCNLFGYTVFYLQYEKDGGWFRLFGYGLSWQNKHIYPRLFSGRMGVNKTIFIGRWRLGIITKTK